MPAVSFLTFYNNSLIPCLPPLIRTFPLGPALAYMVAILLLLLVITYFSQVSVILMDTEAKKRLEFQMFGTNISFLKNALFSTINIGNGKEQNA